MHTLTSTHTHTHIHTHIHTRTLKSTHTHTLLQVDPLTLPAPHLRSVHFFAGSEQGLLPEHIEGAQQPRDKAEPLHKAQDTRKRARLDGHKPAK